MVQDVVFVVLVLLGISILPAMLLYLFLKLIDYGADDQKLSEIQQARREGRKPEFSSDGVQTAWNPDSESEPAGDPIVDRSSAAPQSAPSADAAEETISCGDCGRENDADYDVCWNCASRL
jgi:hypothetical protein